VSVESVNVQLANAESVTVQPVGAADMPEAVSNETIAIAPADLTSNALLTNLQTATAIDASVNDALGLTATNTTNATDTLALGDSHHPAAAPLSPKIASYIMPLPHFVERQRDRWFPMALSATAVIAGLIGTGFVLNVRLAPEIASRQSVESPTVGTSLPFNRDQSFPDKGDWPITDTSELFPQEEIPTIQNPVYYYSTSPTVDENGIPQFQQPQPMLTPAPDYSAEPTELPQQPTYVPAPAAQPRYNPEPSRPAPQPQRAIAEPAEPAPPPPAPVVKPAPAPEPIAPITPAEPIPAEPAAPLSPGIFSDPAPAAPVRPTEESRVQSAGGDRVN
jgi:hypothetical protein